MKKLWNSGDIDKKITHLLASGLYGLAKPWRVLLPYAKEIEQLKAENELYRRLLIRIYRIVKKHYNKTRSEVAYEILKQFTAVDLRK